MKVADVLSALRRRWYVVLISILAAAGAGYSAWGTVPPQYERVGTQLLLPGLATIPEDANPYLYVGGLYQIADVIVRAIGPEDIAEIAGENPGTEIVVERDQSAGAVVVVTVTASSDAAAEASLDDMLVVTERTLGELQDEQRIPEDQRVSLSPLTQATESTVIQKTRMLITALVGGVLLVGGIGAAVLIDSLVRARRRPHRSTAAASVTMGAIPAEIDEETEAARSGSAGGPSADPAAAGGTEAADDEPTHDATEAERNTADITHDVDDVEAARTDTAGADTDGDAVTDAADEPENANALSDEHVKDSDEPEGGHGHAVRTSTPSKGRRLVGGRPRR
jgi:hypothetical protein